MKETEPFYAIAEATKVASREEHLEASKAMAGKTHPNLAINPLPYTSDYTDGPEFFRNFNRPFLLFTDLGDGTYNQMKEFPNVAFRESPNLHHNVRMWAQKKLEDFQDSLQALDSSMYRFMADLPTYGHLIHLSGTNGKGISLHPSLTFHDSCIRWPSWLDIDYYEFVELFRIPENDRRGRGDLNQPLEDRWLDPEFSFSSVTWFDQDGELHSSAT